MKRRRDGKINGDPHLVPLPRQAVEILRELLEGQRDSEGWLFPGERKNKRPMSENTINAALRILRFDTATDQTGHGFRATARTLLAEELGFDVDVIEAQLAHRARDTLGRAYNRTQYIAQRRNMLQAWADYLDQLRTSPKPQLAVVRNAPPAPVRALAAA
jgi:integrase